jgi:phosphate/sulfate permease
MPDSTRRASQAGRPYSTSHTAVPTAIGVAIAMPMTVRRTVPRIGSRKPPDFDWSVSTLGWVTSSVASRYFRPWKAM